MKTCGTSSSRRIGEAKRGLARAALALVCAIATSPAAAQGTVSAETQAIVHAPMTVYAAQDMDFGDIATGGASGVVRIFPTATQTCTATVPLVRTGPCRAAIFSGYAGLFSTIRVQRMPGNMLVLNGPSGSTMTVTNLEYAASSLMFQTANQPTYVEYTVIDLDGMYLFRIGGRLNVGVDQHPGVYNGTITVDLNYN